jgi:hypothetical protein
MRCNICGHTGFGPQGTRLNVRCLKCSSLERTRAMKLHLDRIGLPKRGDKVLHVAPERVISELLKEQAGDGYDGVDLFPELFPHIETRKFDLCVDAETLAPGFYDYIIHSHVLEHVPCNWTMILLFLHRALKPGGKHIFCMPILSGQFEESLQPLSAADAVRRFGQNDHVRRIGRDDLDKTLGMIFKGDLNRYILGNTFSDEVLDRVNIPETERRTLNSSTIFVFEKDDLKITV